ncbi:efflux RND transporter periplasmic adaptor subunit [Terrarubrum flagellatum]|uniref:efflux RND transporter periplasmic adaptor subunit n=1 Tax=Terrirubrum flagellatum TaxID=2895980 RepID=UPI00314501C4
MRAATLATAGKLGVKLPDSGTKVAAGPAPAAAATGPVQRPPVMIKVGKAERKTMPVRFETIGTVQAMATVNIRSRVDSQIMAVEFADGAAVQAGDVLFRLDARTVDAQIKQAEGNLLRSKATLDLNEQDMKRKEQLAKAESTSQALLDTARANVATARAQIKADEAALESLKVQRTFFDIAAPITGRIGVATLKVGSLTKQSESGQVLAMINQISPIYVAFPVPQRLLPDLREAVAAGTAKVAAIPQGITKSAEGKIALLDNSVDATTGTIIARAVFENADELLWPGSLANIRIDLRTIPNSITVPREAVMNGQQGNFVYVVDNGVARMKPVVIDRMVDQSTVISSGLDGTETVVTDGQMQLANGARVTTAPPAARPVAQPPQGAPAAGAPPSQG